MGKTKVCLVFPRFGYISGDPPLGLGYLAAQLQKDPALDVSIVDTTFMHSLDKALDELNRIMPHVVGIYTDGMMSRSALAVAHWSTRHRIYTVFGGPQATVAPEDYIAHSDAVVLGEGESALTDIVRNYHRNDLSGIAGVWWKRNGEIAKNEPRQEFSDLDGLPFPRRDLLPMDKYLYYWNYLDVLGVGNRGTTMIASRGCPFSCTYCQPTMRKMFGEKIRFRSPENVVAEMVMLRRQYHVDGVFFHDDTFTLNRAWLNEFCRALDTHKAGLLWGCNSRIDMVDEDMLRLLHAHGLRNIHFGIESGSQRILDQSYDKKIRLEQVADVIALTRRIGIFTMGFFMLGAPTETEGEMDRTISFARNLPLDEATFSLTTPFQGTYLHDRLLHHDGIDDSHGPLNYYSTYTIKNGVGKRRIKSLQWKALVLFYSHPWRLKYIIRHIFSWHGLRKLLHKVRRFI